MSDNGWTRVSDRNALHPAYARPAPFGVWIQHGTADGDGPDSTEARYDYTVAELEAMLRVAKEAVDG